MKNAKMYKAIIVLLVIMNLGTLAFMWFHRPGREGQVKQQAAAAVLIKELGLTDVQQKEYMQLRREHRDAIDKLSLHDKALHQRFFDLLLRDRPDSLSLVLLADSIAADRRQMEMVTYDHFSRVNNLLNPSQKEKFKIIFNDVLNIVLPPPPPPPGAPPEAGMQPPPLPPPPPPAPPSGSGK
jgi:periplasmic protein CpxP/Spy